MGGGLVRKEAGNEMRLAEGKPDDLSVQSSVSCGGPKGKVRQTLSELGLEWWIFQLMCSLIAIKFLEVDENCPGKVCLHEVVIATAEDRKTLDRVLCHQHPEGQ